MTLVTNKWVMTLVANKEVKRNRQMTLVANRKKTKDIGG